MFRHVGIVVKDLDKQLFFYRDLLGLEVLYDELESGFFLDKILNTKGVKIKIYKLGSEGKTLVELLHYENSENTISEKKINSNGITHFAITLDNLDKYYEFLKKEGVTFLSEPVTNEKSTHKVCFCTDFENNFIELVEEL
jgi:catechol 2,3-dioxygenase-like lactoylglutathione lyase family enzyme